jgi:hypothetical protein
MVQAVLGPLEVSIWIWGYPKKNAGWFISWKIYHEKMDENWGYPMCTMVPLF